MSKVCVSCGKDLQDDAAFCPECGTKIEAQKEESNRFCSDCGTKFEKGVKFCPKCGKPADGGARPIAPVAGPVQNYQQPMPTPMYSPASMAIQSGVGAVDGCATIEIIRDFRFYGLIVPFSVYVDDVEIGKVKNNNHATFNVPVGRHKLMVKENNIGPQSIAEMFNGVSDPFVFDAPNGGYLRFSCNYTFGKFISITPIPLLLLLTNGKRILQVTPKMY